jgi:hypothetical protein
VRDGENAQAMQYEQCIEDAVGLGISTVEAGGETGQCRNRI